MSRRRTFSLLLHPNTTQYSDRMEYNKQRLVEALRRDGIELTKAELEAMDQTWVWMADQMVKTYILWRKSYHLHREELRQAALERQRQRGKGV